MWPRNLLDIHSLIRLQQQTVMPHTKSTAYQPAPYATALHAAPVADRLTCLGKHHKEEEEEEDRDPSFKMPVALQVLATQLREKDMQPVALTSQQVEQMQKEILENAAIEQSCLRPD